MISIRTSADLAAILEGPIAPDLKRLLIERSDQLLEGSDFKLSALVHFVIAEPGDTLAAIEAAAGVLIATNLVDGKRVGDPGFEHNFEFVQRHPGGLLEAVLILSDDGYGVALFVRDRADTDPALLMLLRAAV